MFDGVWGNKRKAADYVWNRVYLTCENNRLVEIPADVC